MKQKVVNNSIFGLMEYDFQWEKIEKVSIFKKEYKSKEKYINLAKLDFSDKVFFREYAIEMLKQFKLLKQ